GRRRRPVGPEVVLESGHLVGPPGAGREPPGPERGTTRPERQPPGPERVATRPECQPSLVGRLALVVGCQPPVLGRLALVLGVAPGERRAALLRAPALAPRLSRLLLSVSARAGRRPQPRPQAAGAARRR